MSDTTNDKGYDGKEIIAQQIHSFRALNDLLSRRHEAGYVRKEQLQKFCLFGRFYLDDCGNIMEATSRFIPKEVYPDIPDVLTFQELQEFLVTNGNGHVDLERLTWRGSDIPASHILCPVCGKGWTIENFHDIVQSTESQTPPLPLSEFTGRSMLEVKKILRQKTDGVFYPLCYEDKPIRKSKDPEKWYGLNDGVNDDYIVEHDDKLFGTIVKYYHGSCKEKFDNYNQHTRFRDMLIEAGFEDFVMSSIPNQYCGCNNCAPWYRVILGPKMRYQEVIIGWRKRVINIDWSNTGVTGDVAKGDNVTKWKTCVHASCEDKAVAYLKALKEMLPF